MLLRRILIPFFAVAVVLFASCGSDDPAAVDTGDRPAAEGDAVNGAGDERVDPEAGDELVDPGTPVSDIGDDPDSNPGGGIEPADGEEVPEQVVTGRVVTVDRDGPSVEIVESTIATGSDATDAARAAGEIGPAETWPLDFYVIEGDRRWIDIDPAVAVAIYDCTQACEHVEGSLEDVLGGPPYAGMDTMWSFVIGDGGLAVSIDQIYLP